MRASVSSRPSAATDSKIPGETVVPVIATRIGWKTSLGFTLEPLDDAAQRLLDPLGVERLRAAASASRALRSRSGAPSRITFAQAFSS